MRKELNTSKYNFKSIIENNCMYVDKTENLYRLVTKSDGQFFLSRPRRFGKSLTLSTLESIFSGDKELFKGLYIYDKMDFEWKKYPIIKLTLNGMSSSTALELEENLSFEMKSIAKRNNIKLESKRSYQQFKELIIELAHKNDLELVFEKALKVFFAKIDYDIRIRHEKYYQTIFYIIFMMLGVRIKTEVKTNDGRMDAVVKTDNRIYIFEFKLDKSTKEALNQIKEKEYYNKYLLDNRKLILIGVNFDSSTGEISDWEVITHKH